MSEIPANLLRHFADSTLSVGTYDAPTGELTYRIEKEIGPEVGTITFHGVTYLATPDCFAGEGMEVVIASDLTDTMCARFLLPAEYVDSNQSVYVIHDQDGPPHIVVAESVAYEVK